MGDLDRLMTAARGGDIDTALSILDEHPDMICRKDAAGAAAIHHAALCGQREIVRLLVERGADVNVRDDEYGATPTGWAIEYLRELCGNTATELEDLGYAIRTGDVRWTKRFLTRFPWLRESFRERALATGYADVIALFEEPSS